MQQAAAGNKGIAATAGGESVEVCSGPLELAFLVFLSTGKAFSQKVSFCQTSECGTAQAFHWVKLHREGVAGMGLW